MVGELHIKGFCIPIPAALLLKGLSLGSQHFCGLQEGSEQ